MSRGLTTLSAVPQTDATAARERLPRNERLARILAWTRGPDVLDIGCAGVRLKTDSPYWLHGQLHRRFPRVVGLDINEAAVRALRAQGYCCFPGNAEHFDLRQRFDTIVAGEVIEHLANPGSFLTAARRHLKPEGRLVLTTPYAFSLFHILYASAKFPRTCPNGEHTVWFCPRTLTELARRVGLVCRHWELIEDYRPEVPSVPYRLFVRLRRLLPSRRLRSNSMLFVFTPA